MFVFVAVETTAARNKTTGYVPSVLAISADAYSGKWDPV